MSAAPYDRLRLTALRYAVNDESEQYVAVMRVFTAGTAGLLSDLSAREVADSLGDRHGLELDVDVVDARLSYLVNHGNLARSPRETEARSIREYLTTRARYQLTQRGELVHRQVEELLAATDEVREVSTEMLGGILAGLRVLEAYDAAALAGADPDAVAGQVATVFAQFERLVTSTRAFYARLDRHMFSAARLPASGPGGCGDLARVGADEDRHIQQREPADSPTGMRPVCRRQRCSSAANRAQAPSPHRQSWNTDGCASFWSSRTATCPRRPIGAGRASYASGPCEREVCSAASPLV